MQSPSTGDRRQRLLLAHLTLIHVSPPDLVTIASRAGYDGVSLHLSARPGGAARYPLLGEGSAMMREVLARMADTGVAVHDVQSLRLNPDTQVADFKPMFEAGARLGARHAILLSDDPDAARNADRIGELSAMAAPFGIALMVEFMVFSGIKTLRDACRLVEQSGAPQACVMVDPLHWMRSGGSLLDIAQTPVARMPYVQICDAPPDAPAGGFQALALEGLKQRLFPGEGGLPLREFLGAFRNDITLSIETPITQGPDGLTDLQIAERAIQSTRRLLASMGSTV